MPQLGGAIEREAREGSLSSATGDLDKMAPAKGICATVAHASSIDPMRLSIHNMPNRIELEFFRCAQQAVSGITGDRPDPKLIRELLLQFIHVRSYTIDHCALRSTARGESFWRSYHTVTNSPFGNSAVEG